MTLIVRKPGILTTVQDRGRFGSRSLGINLNGVMDVTAARLVNIILGNDDGEAVLEVHSPAAEFEFEEDVIFAIGGGNFGAELNGEPVPMWSTISAAKSSVLRFTERRRGNRVYISVSGGFRVDEWLGSRSTNLAAGLGGFHGRKLKAGDRLEFSAVSANESVRTPLTVGHSIIPRYSRFPNVRVIAGAEFDLLTAISERAFLNEGFALTNDSNRMGFRLKGEPLHLLHAKELVSSAVAFGTIQLLPDGQMVVLMADHQTSGGYPRIGNVAAVDLPILAQLGPGDVVGFYMTTIEEAERLAMQFEREIAFLKVGINMRKPAR
jgi:antagonist of KipI